MVNGLSQIFFGLSTELWMLFVCRFFTGVGSAFIVPPVMAYAADLSTKAERGKVMSWLGAAISLGFMIGPGLVVFSQMSACISPSFWWFRDNRSRDNTFMVLPSIKRVIKDQKKVENIIHQMVRSFKTNYFVLLVVVFVFSFGISNFQSTLTMFLTYKFNYTPNDIAIVMTSGGFVGVIVQAFALNKLIKVFGEMKTICLA